MGRLRACMARKRASRGRKEGGTACRYHPLARGDGRPEAACSFASCPNGERAISAYSAGPARSASGGGAQRGAAPRGKHEAQRRPPWTDLDQHRETGARSPAVPRRWRKATIRLGEGEEEDRGDQKDKDRRIAARRRS